MVARGAKGTRHRNPDGSFTVRGKASNGEGSVYGEPDGVWRATYRVSGESRPRRVRGRTRDEALRRRGEALTKTLPTAALAKRTPAGTRLDGRSTVAEVATWWLEHVARHRVRASSLGKYVDRVERIVAWLGDVRVGSLRPEQVARWQAELLSTLSAKTVADTRATLRSVMSEAIDLGVVATNPGRSGEAAKSQSTSRRR